MVLANEDVLTAHPDVIECAAIGVLDDKSGERVKMFVVLSNDVPVSELMTYCKERMTGYKVPSQIVIIDELPKSTVGKVLRRELR